MAFPNTIVSINSDQTVITAGTDTLFYSRWVRGVVDPRVNGMMHIVYELLGQHAQDDIGFSYILWDMVNQEVVRRVDVEPTSSTGTVDFGHPDIAVNPVDGRIWIAYVERGNEENANQNPGGVALYAISSQDMGASWTTRQTVAPGAATVSGHRYLYPRVAFGLDGSGYMSAYRYVGTPADSRHQIFRHDNGNWVLDYSFAHSTTGTFANPAAIVVNPDGEALCIAPFQYSASGTRVEKLVRTGGTWVDQGQIAQWSAGVAPIAPWSELMYDMRNDVYQFLSYPYASGSSTPVQHIEFSRDFQVNFNQGIGWNPYATINGVWIAPVVTTLGNIYLFASTSNQYKPTYRYWDRTTNTWDATDTDLGYETQVADHGAAVEPDGFSAGFAGEYLGRVQLFTSGDEAPTAGAQEYIWQAQDPEAEDVDIADLFLRAGNITALANYEAFSDDLQSTKRRVIAWIGGNCYHDGDEQEFAGNAIEDGKFEAAADFSVFLNDLYIADGKNTLSSWNVEDAQATTVVNTWTPVDGGSPGPVPKMLALEVARDRLWGITTSGLVVGSGLLSGTEWNLASPTLVDVDPVFFNMNDLPDGELPTCIKEFYGSRYIFSENGIVRIRGDRPGILMSDIGSVESALSQTQGQPFVVEKISDTIGCASNRSIVTIGSDTLFLSRKGVHSLALTEKAGDVEQAYVSAPIQTLFRSLNKVSFARATGVNYKKKNWYVINVARDIDNGLTKTLLVFDYVQKAWFVWTFDFEITCLGTRINALSNEEELLAGTSLGYVIVLDTDSQLNELGAAHTATLQSTWIHNGDASTYDKFTRLIFHHRRPSTAQVSGRYWVDDEPPVSFTLGQNPFNQAVIGNFTIGDGGGSPIQGDTIGRGGTSVPVKSSVIVNKRGRTLKVELSSAVGNMSISGLQVEIVPGKFRDII